MDQTTPFQLPYPQCDPPLVKDAADIAHLRDLAVAVDTVVEELAVQADDILVTPDAAVLTNAGTQVLSTPTDQILMTTVEGDTSATGDLAQGADSQFVVQQTGIYLLSCSLRAVFTGSTLLIEVRIDVNGQTTGPYGQSKTLTTVEGGIGFMDVRPLTAGDVVRFRWAGSAVAASVSSARGGIWRMM